LILLKAFGLDTTLTVGTLFCGSNLQDKFPYRSSILPVIEASLEVSVFTKSPQGSTHRKAHQLLTERIKTAGERTLIERGQQLVADLLDRKRKMTLGHTPVVSSIPYNLQTWGVLDWAVPECCSDNSDCSTNRMKVESKHGGTKHVFRRNVG
jgi:hypothetical protein